MTTPTSDAVAVSDTFAHPCIECGTTVHVVNGQAQPHEHHQFGELDSIAAYAWWQGHAHAASTNVPPPEPARDTPSSSSPAVDLSQASPEAIERMHQRMRRGRVCHPLPLNDRNPDVLWCGSCRGDWTERGCREAVRLADLAVGGEVGALRAEDERMRGANERAWRWFETDCGAQRERAEAAEARLRKVEGAREQVADVLYRMNGFAWYGRDLGPFDGEAMEGERPRWLGQADYLLAALAAEPAEVTPPAEQQP